MEKPTSGPNWAKLGVKAINMGKMVPDWRVQLAFEGISLIVKGSWSKLVNQCRSLVVKAGGQRLSTMFQHQAGNKPEPDPVPSDLLPLLDRFRTDSDGTGDGES